MPRGGYRKGGGRPLGSKDRVPRGRSGFDQLKTMVREAEAAGYIYTNDNKEFTGTAMEFLQSVYKCEHLPVKIRVYAAKEAMSIERDAGTPQFDETGKVILFLPHNRRDPLGLHDGDNYRDEIIAQMDRLSREDHRQQDEELRKWIAEGRLHEDCALLCRSQWIEEGDAEWVPVQCSENAVTPQPAPMQYVAPPVRITAPQPSGHDNTATAPVKTAPIGFVVLFCRAHQEFWTAAPHRYTADARGELLVPETEPEDLVDLLRSGARKRR